MVTVLLASADRKFTFALREILEKESGFLPFVVEDGKELSRITHGKGAKVLVLDSDLPDMDILSFLERINPSQIRTVYLSSRGSETLRALSLGVSDSLLKPCKPEYVANRVFSFSDISPRPVEDDPLPYPPETFPLPVSD